MSQRKLQHFLTNDLILLVTSFLENDDLSRFLRVAHQVNVVGVTVLQKRRIFDISKCSIPFTYEIRKVWCNVEWFGAKMPDKITELHLYFADVNRLALLLFSSAHVLPQLQKLSLTCPTKREISLPSNLLLQFTSLRSFFVQGVLPRNFFLPPWLCNFSYDQKQKKIHTFHDTSKGEIQGFLFEDAHAAVFPPGLKKIALKGFFAQYFLIPSQLKKLHLEQSFLPSLFRHQPIPTTLKKFTINLSSQHWNISNFLTDLSMLRNLKNLVCYKIHTPLNWQLPASITCLHSALFSTIAQQNLPDLKSMEFTVAHDFFFIWLDQLFPMMNFDFVPKLKTIVLKYKECAEVLGVLSEKNVSIRLPPSVTCFALKQRDLSPKLLFFPIPSFSCNIHLTSLSLDFKNNFQLSFLTENIFPPQLQFLHWNTNVELLFNLLPSSLTALSLGPKTNCSVYHLFRKDIEYCETHQCSEIKRKKKSKAAHLFIHHACTDEAQQFHCKRCFVKLKPRLPSRLAYLKINILSENRSAYFKSLHENFYLELKNFQILVIQNLADFHNDTVPALKKINLFNQKIFFIATDIQEIKNAFYDDTINVLNQLPTQSCDCVQKKNRFFSFV